MVEQLLDALAWLVFLFLSLITFSVGLEDKDGKAAVGFIMICVVVIRVFVAVGLL